MAGKLFARSGAAAFVGIAVAMTLVQLREQPAAPIRSHPVPSADSEDSLPEKLRACASIGEAALTAPDCLAAWAEKRRRFFGVDHPEAYAGLTGSDPDVAAQPGPE